MAKDYDSAQRSGAEDAILRDDTWLADRVRLLWEMHFTDVPVGFPILAAFGTRARYRFGSIVARSGKSLITVNGLFADPFVPTFVVDGTLTHELAHYVHGFGSGLPRLYRDAHRGGVVDKELEQRGLGELTVRAEQWREKHWDAFYNARCGDLVARRTSKEEAALERWEAVFRRPGARTEEDLQGRLALLAPRFGSGTAVSLPFTVEWLRATPRQTGLSYWFARSRVVRLHGLLADRRVPGVVVDFELGYWLARRSVGERWPSVHRALCSAGMEATAAEAMRWRRHAWTAFRNRNHPLTLDKVTR